MTDYKDIAFPILIVLVMILAIAMGIDKYNVHETKLNQTAFQEGYKLGFNEGQIYIIQTISQTGNIPFFKNATTITSKSIQEICAGKAE